MERNVLDEILSASDLPIRKVHIPQWSRDVFVRSMSGADRDQWELAWTEFRKRQDSGEGFYCFLVLWTLCDSAGKPLCELPPKPSQVKAMQEKSGAAIQRLYTVAAGLNGIGGIELEDAEKNSESAASGSSGSG